MGGSFKIGRFSGIDVKVHWTFWLLLAFFAFLGYQTSGSLLGALTDTVTIVALFICVLLHEFGHSLVAQRLGLEIHSITLLPLGGVSNLESLPEKPSDEVKITLAGPLVNVVLAPIFFGVGLLLGAEPRMPTDLFTGIGSVGQFFFYLGYLNVVLAVFNLIPAFPLDGGRILRALLATRLGAVRATDISSTLGQVFAAAFFLIGLLGGNFFLALIAVFIFFGASGESQLVRQRELTRGLSVSEVMGTKPRTETVTPSHTFGQVLDSVIHGYQEDFPVVDENGKLVGMITREHTHQLPTLVNDGEVFLVAVDDRVQNLSEGVRRRNGFGAGLGTHDVRYAQAARFLPLPDHLGLPARPKVDKDRDEG